VYYPRAGWIEDDVSRSDQLQLPSDINFAAHPGESCDRSHIRIAGLAGVSRFGFNRIASR
jgi:hypothetical protein